VNGQLEFEQATPEVARHLTDRIKVALDASWELIKEAYVTRAWAALGYAAWDEYCTREFGNARLRLPREERQEVVASLRESGLSLRAIAAATGQSHTQVRDDLSGVRNLPPAESDTESAESDKRPESAPPVIPSPPAPTITGSDGRRYPSVRPQPPRPSPPPQPTLVTADDDEIEDEIEVIDGLVMDEEAAALAEADAKREDELDAQMEETAARFRRNFSAALARADDVWQFDVDRIAELYAASFERDLSPWLTEMERWCQRVNESIRHHRSGLRVVQGGVR